MNIIIVGGGTKGKFGNDFVIKARSEGHRVYILSHEDNGDNDPDLHVISFDFSKSLMDKLEVLLPQIDSIDIIIYNSNPGGYPNNGYDDLTSRAWLNEQNYYNTLRHHVVYPHLLILWCYSLLKEQSKIVFMTTGLALSYKTHDWQFQVGYLGAKSWQTHLMTAFSKYNDKSLIFSSIAPYFNYDNREQYNEVFDAVYNYILNHDNSYNGKIVRAYNKDLITIN